MKQQTNGLKPPEYTQVPNALLDNMADMSDVELRCTLALVRQIVGWHKTKPEAVSYSQLMTITGLSRQGVTNGIKAALERGTVKLSGKGKQGVNLYTLNFVDTSDELVNTVDQSTTLTTTSQHSRPQLVNVVDTPKKVKEKKEKIIAAEPQPAKPDSTPMHNNNPHEHSIAVQEKQPELKKRSPAQLELDAMINAIAAAFGLDCDKVTDTQWSEFRKSGKELIKVGAKPDDMAPLYGWCKQQGWNGGFTSVAMAKNFANFEKSRKPVGEPITRKAPHEEADPNCAMCKGQGVVKVNKQIVPCDCRQKQAKKVPA